MDYYDSIAEGYDELHGEEQARKFKVISKHAGLTDRSTMLDVGCGTGLSAVHLPGRITGIDPAKKLLDLARGRLSNVICGSAEHLPFRTCSFEVVISLTSVHNFDDADAGIAEIARVASNTVVISILKTSSRYDEMIRSVEVIFKNWLQSKFTEDQHDAIFIFRRPGR